MANVEGAETFISMIQRNSLRVQQLITDLLQFTKFAKLTFDSVHINDLLDQLLTLARYRTNLHRITVVKKYSENICDIIMDAGKLKIAFLNIIVNAIEAMQPGNGVLTSYTYKQDDNCCIAIANNGTGMNGETLQKLFEPLLYP